MDDHEIGLETGLHLHVYSNCDGTALVVRGGGSRLVASRIGAVNTIKYENGKLIGYNTDVPGIDATDVSGNPWDQGPAYSLLRTPGQP